MKVIQEKALSLIIDLNQRLGSHWMKFISSLRMQAEQDDQRQIYFDRFR